MVKKRNEAVKVLRVCLRCSWKWLDRGKGKPKVCASCHSPYWDTPRGGG